MARFDNIRELDVNLNGAGLRVGIVMSRFNRDIGEGLLSACTAALLKHGVREADVPDVCQETFVVVHRKLAEFEGRSALKTWIYGICARTASDYRRRAHVRVPAPGLTSAGYSGRTLCTSCSVA